MLREALVTLVLSSERALVSFLSPAAICHGYGLATEGHRIKFWALKPNL